MTMGTEGAFYMKIAISSSGDSLAAHTHSLFGRCDYFIIVDTETGESTALKNNAADASTGAGPACAQELFNAGVKAVVSGKIGPNAYETLKAAGMGIFLAPPGMTVQETLDRFKAGSLSEMQIQRF
jgi:predicted Fe-Mo cluster-binding NifX family protein